MELIAKNKNICTGCLACQHACPVPCIGVEKDSLGFSYPVIDLNECVDCNACNEACPAICEKEKENVKAYAVVNVDESVRLKSSSGGVFTALAKAVIIDGGFVVGAAFSDDFKVRHTIIDKEDDIHLLQGSKYVQSSIEGTYSQIENCLKTGKEVLFSGTPCQVDGVNKTFGHKDNLITCSVVCHGVPSPMVFDKYKRYISGLLGENIKDIKFRDKTNSWRLYDVKITGVNNKEYKKSVAKDAYMKGFIESLYLGQSCYNCPSKPITGDIVLGDFWGIENYHTEMDDDKGTSMVLVNKKGEKLLDRVRDVKFVESEYENCISHNPAIYRSTKKNEHYDEFTKDFSSLSFDKIIKKYLSPDTRMQYIKKRVKGIFIKR